MHKRSLGVFSRDACAPIKSVSVAIGTFANPNSIQVASHGMPDIDRIWRNESAYKKSRHSN